MLGLARPPPGSWKMRRAGLSNREVAEGEGRGAYGSGEPEQRVDPRNLQDGLGDGESLKGGSSVTLTYL